MANDVRRVLTVRSDTSLLAQVRMAVVEVAGQGVSPSKANMLALAVDEAVTNVIEHAHGGKDEPADSGKITITLSADGLRFEALICYKGASFDSGSAPEIDLLAHIRSGSKRGLGLFLMRRIMDEIKYSHKPDMHNELRMIKYIDGRGAGAKSKGHRKTGPLRV